MPEKYVKDWDELANADAKWSIVSDPEKKYNKWNDADFFKTGEDNVGKFMQKIRELNVESGRDVALDFGCGIGRLTKALSKYYKKVYGIDVSEMMILEAGIVHKENNKVKFIKNSEADLKIFEDNKFDLIYSFIVLQHLPSKKLIRTFLEEFKRTLKPTGLFFQLPSIKSRSRLFDKLLKIRSTTYHLMIRSGFSRQFCFRRLNLSPYMYMNYIPCEEILSLFSENFRLLDLTHEKSKNTSYIFQKI